MAGAGSPPHGAPTEPLAYLPFPAPGQIDGAQVADGLDGVGGRGALLAEIVPAGSSVHGDLAHVRLQIQVIVGAWQGGFQGQGAQVALEAVIPGQAALDVDIPHIGHGLQAVAAKVPQVHAAHVAGKPGGLQAQGVALRLPVSS